MRFWELRVDHSVDELWGKDEKANQTMSNRRGLTGTSMKDTWEPIELMTVEPGEDGDMISYGKNSIYPIFTEKSLQVLIDLIQESVEILPLQHEQYQCYLINIINVLDCLNEQNSYLNKWGVIMKYDLIEEVVRNQHIFFVNKKSTGKPSLVPIISDVFKQRVEDNGLRGFRFTCIWDIEAEVQNNNE
jgi:hypothetical protein